jgi:hypothetical protein
MICTICGDRAVGFNYNVLSCAPCKIYFHRNATHQHSVSFCFFLLFFGSMLIMIDFRKN